MKTRLFVLAIALFMSAISAVPQKPKPVITVDSKGNTTVNGKPVQGGGDPSKPPVISDALKAKFFKAQLALQNAQSAFQKAQQDSITAAQEITKACGDGFQPQMDAQGDPACVAKPKPAKK